MKRVLYQPRASRLKQILLTQSDHEIPDKCFFVINMAKFNSKFIYKCKVRLVQKLSNKVNKVMRSDSLLVLVTLVL